MLHCLHYVNSTYIDSFASSNAMISITFQQILGWIEKHESKMQPFEFLPAEPVVAKNNLEEHKVSFVFVFCSSIWPRMGWACKTELTSQYLVIKWMWFYCDRQEFLEDLAAKEPEVAAVRKKAHKLMHNRDHAKGYKDVKRQIKNLGNYFPSCKSCFQMDKMAALPLIDPCLLLLSPPCIQWSFL